MISRMRTQKLNEVQLLRLRTNEDYHSTKRHTREIVLNKG